MSEGETTLSGVVERIITTRPDTAFAAAVRTHDHGKPATVGEVVDAKPATPARRGQLQTEALGAAVQAHSITLLAPATEKG
ncbi:MAG: hypothetical protein R3D03_08230 [Geminicoccaceae bacterium]